MVTHVKMGKNKGAGGSSRRKGKKNAEASRNTDTVFREDGMGYGYVEKTLGNGRFHISCDDGQTRLGILCGSLRKKVWIIVGDIVLYSIRDFQDSKIDIIHKYTNNDVSKLYLYEEITKKMYDIYTSDIHNHIQNDTDVGIVFAHEDDDTIGQNDLTEWTKIGTSDDASNSKLQALINAI